MARSGPRALDIVQRILAAALGGYILAWAASVMLARILPLDRYQAVQWAVMASFLIYLGAILWSFRARPLARMWAGLAGPSAICGALAWWLDPSIG